MWWRVFLLALVAVAITAVPAREPRSPYDLMQIDTPLIDDDPEVAYPLLPMRSGNTDEEASWLYLRAPQQAMHNDNGPYAKVRVGARPMPQRPRRDFSLYPAVDLLRKMAVDHSMNKQIERNRNFLDSRGKKDANVIPDWTN